MVLENNFPFDERVEKEALSLTGQGHEVHLACATTRGDKEYEEYKGIFLHRVKSSSFYYNKSRPVCLTLPFYFLFWRKFLSRLLSEIAIDTIHIHDLPLAKIGIELSKKFNKKLVIDFHENFPYMLKEEEYTKTLTGRILSPISKWITYEANILRKIDNAIFVCKEMKTRMLQISSVRNSIELDNTIDIERWPKYEKQKKDGKYIRTIYVGGFTLKRGIEVAIKGIAQFNKQLEQKAILDLYGSAKKDYINSLLKLADDEGIADYVNFKGYINLPEDAQQLGTYDVGLIPHLKNTHTDNTSPNKIFQYYNYKLPVLCSDCNYLVRLVDETKGGLIYDNQSPIDFAKKLQSMCNENDLQKYGEQGYNSILDKYSWDKSVTNLVEFYKNI